MYSQVILIFKIPFIFWSSEIADVTNRLVGGFACPHAGRIWTPAISSLLGGCGRWVQLPDTLRYGDVPDAVNVRNERKINFKTLNTEETIHKGIQQSL